MFNTNITAAGNPTETPRTTVTPNGKTITEFRLLVNPRIQRDGEWVDGTPIPLDVKCFGRLAEHVAASLTTKTRAVVIGSLVVETWADRSTGETRTKQVLLADEVALSLAWSSVNPTGSTGSTGSASTATAAL